jgi:hypothetical protein
MHPHERLDAGKSNADRQTAQRLQKLHISNFKTVPHVLKKL